MSTVLWKIDIVLFLSLVGLWSVWHVRRNLPFSTSSVLMWLNYKGDDRTKISKQLQRGQRSQQDLFLNVCKEADVAVEASYLVSEWLTKVGKSFTEGQFLKDCMLIFYVEDHCDVHCETCPNIIPLFVLCKRSFLFIFKLNMFTWAEMHSDV